MGRGDDKPEPSKARFALAANLGHLMATYSKGFAVGINAPELQKGCGVSAKTIRRILDPYSPHSPTLENLDVIAGFFRVETWDLLRPHPPAIKSQDVEVTVPPKPSKSRK